MRDIRASVEVRAFIRAEHGSAPGRNRGQRRL